MSKLVALLRVKDGIIFVDDWLKKMDELCDEIVVVDNGSTDGTYEKMKAHPKVVDIARTEGFDEGRDKIMVHEMARKRNPDWLIWLDVDEIFEDRITRKDMDKYMNQSTFTKIRFRRYHMFNDENHYLASFFNLMELAVPSRLMWKETNNTYFRNLKIHNGGIQGVNGKALFSPFRIKHLCNLHENYRVKAYNNYISIDPSNTKMYSKHRNILVAKKSPTLKFFDPEKTPTKVKLGFIMLNILFPFAKIYFFIVKKLKKLFK